MRAFLCGNRSRYRISPVAPLPAQTRKISVRRPTYASQSIALYRRDQGILVIVEKGAAYRKEIIDDYR